jgi:hypothetical protein
MMVFVFVLMAAAMALLLLVDPPWFSVQTSVHRMPPCMDYHSFKTLLIFRTIYVLILKIDTSGLNHVCVENPNLRYNKCARQNRSNILVLQN